MPDQGSRSPARILAPLALAVFALVFIAIVLGSGGSGGSGGGGSTSSQPGSTTTAASRTGTTSKQATTTTQSKGGRATYTVKVGDTLGSIAQKTGVPVEKLLELNPDLDPQALVSGQKVKLRG